MEALGGFDEDADFGGALVEEGDLLGDVIADGIALLGAMRQKCDPHEVPP
jgi:hypothetical protein